MWAWVMCPWDSGHLLNDIKSFLAKTHFVPWLTTGATGQGFVARLSTGGDGIRAALSFWVAQFQEFGQLRLTAGTSPHQGWRAWARLTGTAVAHLLAPVGFTVQHPAQRESYKIRRNRLWREQWKWNKSFIINGWWTSLVLLTFHMFSDRRNVPNHQILLYLFHTGLYEL